MIAEVLQGYAAAATPELIARYDTIPVGALFAPVADLLPIAPSRIADIGAGTGRDAAWFAARGHDVTAVEPVAALREAGMALHADAGISWVDDRLPQLSVLASAQASFDLILLIGVWQHLDEAQRRSAMTRLAALLAPRGRLILSLRSGPASAGRPVLATSSDATIADASACGLSLLRRERAESIQAANRAAGVSWTWLAFQDAGERANPDEPGR